MWTYIVFPPPNGSSTDRQLSPVRNTEGAHDIYPLERGRSGWQGTGKSVSEHCSKVNGGI
jgi:hypothetical protein